MYSAFAQLWGTLNNRQAASPLVRLVAGDERWETPDPPAGCSPSELGTVYRTVICIVLNAKSNDMRTSSPLQ
ncbi:hypothetical protein TNCV_856551 [Trichonephila clavipes]|nr:hypothetical protein TNCV_856551 [Trichonephila clavipes]